MSAEFKVIKIDPEGSGQDYCNHLDLILINARRCCNNCTVIFGTIDDNDQFGPFIPGELEPLNEEAVAIMEEIIQKLKIDSMPRKLRKVEYTKEFLESKEKIFNSANVNLKVPSFGIQKGKC